ncbi:fatty acid desaturase [Streptomyces sp. L7]
MQQGYSASVSLSEVRCIRITHVGKLRFARIEEEVNESIRGQGPSRNGKKVKKKPTGSPPGKLLGTAIFWFAVAVLIASPLTPQWLGVILALCAIEPVIYATHEALHIESNGTEKPDLYAPRVIATVGMAFQLQNIEILRLAHLFHHRMGRYGNGWAPDVSLGAPTPSQKLRYYAGLVFLPAFCWQVAGIVRPFLPLKRQPYLTQIGYHGRVTPRFILAMALTIAYPAYYVAAAGPLAFLRFWIGLCFLWCIQQNIAHYGLTGIDASTDRVCAHTYYLPRPFSWVTYGSTAHFLHHANMGLSASELYSEEELKRVEDRLQLTIRPKCGITPYIADIVRQFHGPVPVANLTLDWVVILDRPASEHVSTYAYRRGRSYVKNNSESGIVEPNET